MPGNQFWVGENGRIESSELINLNSYEPTKTVDVHSIPSQREKGSRNSCVQRNDQRPRKNKKPATSRIVNDGPDRPMKCISPSPDFLVYTVNNFSHVSFLYECATFHSIRPTDSFFPSIGRGRVRLEKNQLLYIKKGKRQFLNKKKIFGSFDARWESCELPTCRCGAFFLFIFIFARPRK